MTRQNEMKKLLKEIRAIKKKYPNTMKGLAKKYPNKSFEEIFGWK